MAATDTQTGLLFTFRLVPLVNTMLARRGIDGAALLVAAGLPLAALGGEITAPLGRILRFIDDAAVRLETDLFGIDLAELVPSGAYGVPEFLVRSAPDVAAGLRSLSEHAALVNPISQFRYTTDRDGGHLHYAVGARRDTLGIHLNEYTILFISRQLASILGAPAITRAWFSHTRGKRAAAVEHRFGCPVAFGAADCGFTVSHDVLVRAPRTADPPLHAFLREQAHAQLARLGEIDIVSQVMRVVEARLPHGDLAAGAVASAMAITVRTLQRHLTNAGTSYRDVLEHIRRRRRAELRRGGIGDAAIAHQLGFSDARAMKRALAN
ncbi:MAG: AraC family transcriptional regulator [Myxococcales bacterium]|nr:AraC family transcriptional regulator [Myxococcales bacterium]